MPCTLSHDEDASVIVFNGALSEMVDLFCSFRGGLHGLLRLRRRRLSMVQVLDRKCDQLISTGWLEQKKQNLAPAMESARDVTEMICVVCNGCAHLHPKAVGSLLRVG